MLDGGGEPADGEPLAVNQLFDGFMDGVVVQLAAGLL